MSEQLTDDVIGDYLRTVKNNPLPDLPAKYSGGPGKEDSDRVVDQNYLSSLHIRDLISKFEVYINSEGTFKALRQLSELVEDENGENYTINLPERIEKLPNEEDKKTCYEVQRLCDNIIAKYLREKPKYPLTIEEKIQENGEIKINKKILNDLEHEIYSVLEPKYTGIEDILEIFFDNSLKGANLIIKNKEKNKEIGKKEKEIKKIGVIQKILAGMGITGIIGTAAMTYFNLIDHETQNIVNNIILYSGIGLGGYSEYLIKRPIAGEIEKLKKEEKDLVERIEDFALARDKKRNKCKLGLGDISGSEE